MIFKCLLSLLLLLLPLPSLSSPYNRWGPGESYGHTGSDLPPDNPNAIYGYDRAGLLGDSTNYGSVYNRHRSGRLLPASAPFSFPSSRRRSDVDDGDFVTSNGLESPRYRRARPHQEFYTSLEALFGRFRTPRIYY